MDTVTYPDAGVQKQLARWVLVPIDIAEQEEIAKTFGVVAIPVAVALTGDGAEIDRVENFVEPQDFARKLAEWANR